jgi:predicted DNA binding CopG/RHH family protein
MGAQMVKKDTTFKLRLPSDLLAAAKAKAERADTPLAYVIRQFLMEWVKDDPSQQSQEGEKPPRSE